MNQCQNNATSCFNTYQMQDLIYIESMFVICQFDAPFLVCENGRVAGWKSDPESALADLAPAADTDRDRFVTLLHLPWQVILKLLDLTMNANDNVWNK